MTTTVGYAALQIIPSTRGFGSALSSQVTGASGIAGTTASRSFGSRFVGGLKSIAGPAAALLGAAAIGSFVKGSITAASDLNESLNAVNVTFGKSAAGIKTLGEEAATSLGLSNNEFNSLAVRFSSFAKTAAGPGGDVVKTMDDLTTRASDFASVMNLDVNEAAQLFQSGLAGESEPLRKYGIDMSAAAVEAFAFSSGIAKSGETLTEQQKVQARYALLMKSTSKAQGDFANTSGGLANATRIAKAQFTDLQASLGKALLPALSGVMSFIAQKVIPGFKGLYDLLVKGDFTAGFAAAFGIAEDSPLIPQLLNIRDTVIEVAKTVGGVLVTAFGVLKSVFGNVVGAAVGFVKLLYQYRDIALPVAAGIGAIVLAMKAWGIAVKIAAAIGKAFAAVQLAINIVMSANPIGLIVLAIIALVAALVVVYKRSESFRAIVDAMWASIKKAFAAAIGFIVPLVQKGWALILTAFNWLRTNIWPLVKRYLSLISTVFRTYVKVWWTVVKVAWTVITTLIKAALKVIVPIVKVGFKIISTVFKVVWKVVSTIVKVAWAVIKGYVQVGVKVITGIIHTIQAIVGFIVGVWNKVTAAFRAGVDKAKALVQGAVDRILAIFDFVKKMYDAAANFIGGFVQGIIDKAHEIMDAIKEYITDKLPGWIKGPLGIASPSKLTYQYGQWIAEGLALGIKAGSKDVEKATQALADAVGAKDIAAARKALMEAEVAQQKELNQQMKTLTDQAVSIAQRAVDKIKAQGQAALSFAKSISSSVQSFGALTADSESAITGKSVVADLASKVAAAKQFGSYLIRLKRLGLNNTSLQQIIAAGPIDGSQIAKALLTSGEKAVRQVNQLETQLGRASRTVGEVGVQSQFGMTTSQARAQAGAKLEVQKDAVKITFNGDPGPGIKKDVADAVDDAFDRVMDRWERKVAREARSRQRN